MKFCPCIHHWVLVALVQDFLTADSCLLDSKWVNCFSQTGRSSQEKTSPRRAIQMSRLSYLSSSCLMAIQGTACIMYWQQDTPAMSAVLRVKLLHHSLRRTRNQTSATGQNTHSSPTHLSIVGRSQAKRENNLMPCILACKILLSMERYGTSCNNGRRHLHPSDLLVTEVCPGGLLM